MPFLCPRHVPACRSRFPPHMPACRSRFPPHTPACRSRSPPHVPACRHGFQPHAATCRVRAPKHAATCRVGFSHHAATCRMLASHHAAAGRMWAVFGIRCPACWLFSEFGAPHVGCFPNSVPFGCMPQISPRLRGMHITTNVSHNIDVFITNYYLLAITSYLRGIPIGPSPLTANQVNFLSARRRVNVFQLQSTPSRKSATGSAPLRTL